MKRASWILASLLLGGAAVWPARAQTQKLPEPQLPAEELVEATFGDDWNVQKLAELLDGADTIDRAWAVQQLGQTHNLKALPYIRRALDDGEPAIRATAVSAAGEIARPESYDIILKALGSDDSQVLLAAMRTVVDLGLKQAAAPVGKLLSSANPAVRGNAIKTLTSLGVAGRIADLEKLIRDASTRVRLTALENAMLLGNAQGLSEAFQAAAGGGNPPAVRSMAFEAIGKFAWSAGQRIVSASASAADPLVRRGVVRAYHNAGQGQGPAAAAFLDDPSEMVRLAAIRAAGDLKQADRIDRLFEMMFQAEDDVTRQAARAALGKIGTSKVVAKAADALPRWATTPPPPSKPAPTTQSRPAGWTRTQTASSSAPAPYTGPTAEQIKANVASCCWLLGELKSTEQFQYQLSVLSEADVVSPVLLVQAPALGKIGDPKAIAPLRSLLGRCSARGQQYLKAVGGGQATPPWDPQVPNVVVRALADLKAYDALDDILSLGNLTNSRGSRLDACATAIIQSLPALTTPDNTGKVQTFIITVIAERGGYMLTPRFHAVKLAGRMKLEAAMPALLTVLNKERPGRTMMLAAAWAIQEITGKTPEIPEPRRNQGRQWAVRQLEEQGTPLSARPAR